MSQNHGCTRARFCPEIGIPLYCSKFFEELFVVELFTLINLEWLVVPF